MFERNQLSITNGVDANGNPAGGVVIGIGLKITWQNKPLGRPADEPIGCFVEDVIEAARQRLDFYQTASGGKFACRENALAITKLEEALHWLTARRMDRERRGVQGLNKV